MVQQEGQERPGAGVRRRLVLENVKLGQVSGFVIPSHRYGSVPYRGQGQIDYACGHCGHLLAVGAGADTFRGVLLACGCGALNKVPDSSCNRPGAAGASPWAG